MQLDSGELWDYQERKHSGKTFDVGPMFRLWGTKQVN